MKLTEEQKQVKLAKACGIIQKRTKELGEFEPLPDYSSDLNACHSAWETAIRGNAYLEDKYSIELLRAVGAEDPSDGTRPNGSDATWALASNAPSQARFEALGITLSLWTANE